MRGAGTADHTGDSSSGGKHGNNGAVDPAVEREELRRTMSTCAVSGQPLRFGKANETIVTCPYGRLYHKEAAVEALLKRKQEDTDALGDHIRGLKDLKEVRFHFTTKDSDDGTSGTVLVPTCPIRGTELNGQIPAIALIPGGTINVVSERAFKEMGDEILEEYGPSKKTIRLAPTTAQLKEIIAQQQTRGNDERKSSKKGKGEKKRKHKEDKSDAATVSTSLLGNEIRAKVASKVQKSEALSSLFTSTDKRKKATTTA